MIVKKIGVLSLAKVLAVIYGSLGLIFGAFFALLSLLGAGIAASGGEEEALVGVLFGAGAVVFLPVFYGVLGFIGGLIVSSIYNLAARFVGGIEVDLE